MSVRLPRYCYEEKYLDTYDDSYKFNYEKKYSSSYDSGYDDGYDDGYKDGYDKGYDEGIDAYGCNNINFANATKFKNIFNRRNYFSARFGEEKSREKFLTSFFNDPLRKKNPLFYLDEMSFSLLVRSSQGDLPKMSSRASKRSDITQELKKNALLEKRTSWSTMKILEKIENSKIQQIRSTYRKKMFERYRLEKEDKETIDIR